MPSSAAQPVDLRHVVADARLLQLRSLTPLPPGPVVLKPLAGASALGFGLAPSGHTLGVTATGSGQALTDAMADLCAGLLTAAAADQVRTIGALAGHDGLVAEVVVGAGGWMRVGASGVGRDRARAILQNEGVSAEEQARLLTVDGATVAGVSVFADGVHPPTLAVTHRLDAPGDVHTVTLLAHQPGRRQLRGPGLADRALITWLVEQGLATEATVGRLGRAHSILETTGPEARVWWDDAPGESLVFLYANPE